MGASILDGFSSVSVRKLDFLELMACSLIYDIQETSFAISLLKATFGLANFFVFTEFIMTDQGDDKCPKYFQVCPKGLLPVCSLWQEE